MGVGKKEVIPSPIATIAGGKSGPGKMRKGELNLSLTGCNTQQSEPYILPGQLNRADPIDGGTCILAPSMYMRGLMNICHLVKNAREKCPPPSPTPCHLWQM